MKARQLAEDQAWPSANGACDRLDDTRRTWLRQGSPKTGDDGVEVVEECQMELTSWFAERAEKTQDAFEKLDEERRKEQQAFELKNVAQQRNQMWNPFNFGVPSNEPS